MALKQAGLAGRTAIITGAGKGLGRAYALHLAACGARLVVNNRRHPGETDEQTSAGQVVAEIRAAGGEALANWDDVADPDSGRRLVEQALAAYGALDVVIANAGVGQTSMFHKDDLAAFHRVFAPSFLGNLHLVHAAWPILRQRRYGRVILTASSAGLHGGVGMTAYAAAKGATIALMRSLAIEGLDHGIRVNVIAPYAASQMTLPHLSARQAALLSPAAVAPVLAWLAAEDCDVTGQIYVAAGGYVRRAEMTESGALPFAGGASLHALERVAAHGYASGNASFDAFMAEWAPKQ